MSHRTNDDPDQVAEIMRLWYRGFTFLQISAVFNRERHWANRVFWREIHRMQRDPKMFKRTQGRRAMDDDWVQGYLEQAPKQVDIGGYTPPYEQGLEHVQVQAKGSPGVKTLSRLREQLKIAYGYGIRDALAQCRGKE